MNIQVLSDLHLEFEGFEVDYSSSDVVVLAGDVHVGDKGVKWALNSIQDTPVIYVLGNHEYYGCTYPKLVREVKELAKGTNVHVLENESIKIGSVVFHGCILWTDFKLFGDPRIAGYECQQRITDFKKIRREPSYSKMRSLDVALINKNSVDWLGSLCDMTDSATHVVVTHHAPSMFSVPEQYKTDIVSAAYASNLEGWIRRLDPVLWIHGHMHSSCDYKIGRTRVVCNPRGYPGERNDEFRPECIVPI